MPEFEEQLLNKSEKEQQEQQNDQFQNQDQNKDIGSSQIIQKTKSIETIGSLINQMMGGTMLALPILFVKNGIIGGTINMAIQCIISCKTCLIYLTHFKSTEKDFQQTIKRILGVNYEFLFKLIKFMQTFLVTLLYFYLITSQLYMLFTFIIESSTDNPEKYYVPQTDKEYFVFDRFSQPYMSLITAFICGYFTFQKDMVIVVKIASYGLISIFGFVIFVFFVFFENILSKEFQETTHNIPLWSLDVGELAGTASLAFCVQISAGPTLKCNQNQNNNRRDVIIVYLSAAIMYISIGIFGSLSVLDNCINPKATLLNECFGKTQISNLIIILSYVFNLITSFPIYYKIMKQSLYALLKYEFNTKQETFLNIGVIIFCFIIRNIPGLDPDILMSLNGAVCCFFISYMIPIFLHMKCYHGTNKLLRTIKQSMSRIGIIKKDTRTEIIGRLKSSIRRQSEFQFRQSQKKVISFKQSENLSLKKSVLNLKESQKTISYKMDGSKVISTNSNKTQNNDESTSKITVDINSTENNQNNKEKIDNYNYNFVNVHEQKEEEDDEDLQGYESCNDHDFDKGYTKTTLRIILYSIIGLLGLTILIYEMFLIVKRIFTTED